MPFEIFTLPGILCALLGFYIGIKNLKSKEEEDDANNNIE